MLRATPPGENGIVGYQADTDEIENMAAAAALDGADSDEQAAGDRTKPSDTEFLKMATEAEAQASAYAQQVNRRSWQRTYKAFHQEHFTGSKYTHTDYRNRSKLFIPKTRAAVRKDLAATSASLFGSIDAVNCMAGNEADPRQRASAAVVQELVNYRTSRASQKASIPWFHVALGARQTSVLAGICLSKQSWKLELRRDGTEDFDDEDGNAAVRDVYVPDIDRPDIQLIPPENFIIDPAADWTNPAQAAAYIIIKWPMQIGDVEARQRDPRNPWKKVAKSILKSAVEGGKMDAAAIRRAREQGIDRLDETQTGTNFGIVWVWEAYIRTAGEDWTFFSVGDKAMLTEPRPVREVYPEQMGERPLCLGYGAFEAFSIFPMSPAESWQSLQLEANDLRNLTMDAIKQNVTPVTKVVRGRQVDLEQLKRRAHNTSIMVNSPDDVTWDRPPEVPNSVQHLKQQLDVEFDDLAGQQNYGTVQDNNALGRTLGGLKLAAGAANAVQEFDIRIWIETWCEPVLTQLVRLEQFYESDPVVLGLCGERAQLMQKYGINEIDDDLLENNITIRVNIGLGAGDPQQRLAKFNSAVTVASPFITMDPDFKSGAKKINTEAVMEEVFGSAGYRDGGKRFIMEGKPAENAMQGPELDKLKSEAEKNRAMAKAAILKAVTDAAKVGLGQQEMQAIVSDMQFRANLDHMDQIGRATEMAYAHADRRMAQQQPGPGAAVPATTMPAMAEASPAPAPVGQGNAPLGPNDLMRHGVPAANAGEQQIADAAGQAAALTKKTPKNRRVAITRRGPDGRAVEFNIIED